MLISVILAAAAFYLLSSVLSNAFDKHLRQYPGPFVARFSNLWRLLKTADGDFEQTLYALHKKYGDVVRIGPRVLSISDPKVIGPIYGSKTDFIKSDYFNVMQAKEAGKIIPTLVTTKSKTGHAALRRPIAGSFSMSSVRKYEPLIDSAIRSLLEELDKRYISKGEACAIDRWIQYWAFDVTGDLTFSKPFGFLKNGRDVQGQISSVEEAFRYFSIAGQMPWIDYILTKHPITSKIFQPSNPYIEAAKLAINDRLTSSEAIKVGAQRHDLSACFVEAQQTSPETVSDDAVVGYVMTMLLAGSDTTSVALRAAMYYIARDVRVQGQLRKELDGVDDLGSPARWDACRDLPYLDAAIKESQRIHPIGAILQERIVPEEGLRLPDGRSIPSGTIVGVAGWNLNRRQEVYGDDVEVFRPERWLQGKDEPRASFEARLAVMTRYDVSFGHGPRSCIGRNIALLELKKFVATFVKLFEFEMAVPGKPWKTVSGTMIAQTNMDMVFRRRVIN